jgi:hypothetical protein
LNLTELALEPVILMLANVYVVVFILLVIRAFNERHKLIMQR